MQANPSAQTIEIRYSIGHSTTITCLGGVLLVLGILNALSGGSWIAPLLIGSVWTLIGVFSFTRPYASFDPTNGALATNALIGSRSRVVGGPKGEQLVSDGSRVYRIGQDGRRRRVAMMGTDKTGRERLIAALPRVQ